MSIQSIRRILTLLGAFVALGALAASPAGAEPAEKKARYIVVFKDSVAAPTSLARTQTENRDAKLSHVYRHAAKGYAAKLTKREVEGLRKDRRVKFVARDHRLKLFAQSNPTGIERVFATENEALDIDEEDDERADVDVAVIDTGIYHEHPDLDVVGGADCATEKEGSFECEDGLTSDYSGHGTHVAGTIGAIDNGEGVVGVAPGARLWSVQVHLFFPAEVFESSAMAGVDWVTGTREDEDPENDIEVANMSFGCTDGFDEDCESLPALESAISSAVQEGIVMVAAAGNEGTDAQATHPASHPDVITVSALEDLDGSAGESDDPLASFSNYGETIEVAAPGVDILSTVPGGYFEASGTSMASPHVAGAAALLAEQDPPDDKEDVEAIRDTIVEEGNLNWEDTSEDGIQEPLLDVSDESVFSVVHPPVVTTQAASEVSYDEATLNATVDPNGLSTTYQFEYGTTAEYGSKAPAEPKGVGSGTSPLEVEETIEGLQADTTYHFRVVASNEAGTSYGADMEFTTLGPPKVVTKAASGLAAEAATLNATANPNGLATTYQFEYGKTTEYGSKAPAEAKAIGSGTTPVEVDETIEGLEPDTTYHFRVAATNDAGTSYGEDMELTTEAPAQFLKNGQKIEEPELVELEGEIAKWYPGPWEGEPSSFGCTVKIEAYILPGGMLIAGFETKLPTCFGENEYAGCLLKEAADNPGGSSIIDLTPEGEVILTDEEPAEWLEMGGECGFWVEQSLPWVLPKEFDLTPDNGSEISSFDAWADLSETIYSPDYFSGAFGYREPLHLIPKGVYGIG